MRVHKFTLEYGDQIQTVKKMTKLVHVGVQRGEICLWFETGDQEFNFRVFGTGHEIPEGWRHRGTVVIEPFVWHVYEQLSSWVRHGNVIPTV